MKKFLLFFILIVAITTLSGCIKPYDKPEYVEIKPNQTAFVIPLEGKSSEQGKFESEAYLKETQVATKRIQIPHKQIKVGRHYWNIKFVDTVRVIVVDRYPETREWTNDAGSGTSNKAQGFVGESKDSIKFQVGISATAQITEKDASTFLYRYNGKTLAQVMDFEVRNKIGTVLLEEYGTMDMTQIRTSKTEVIEHVRAIVTPYFEERGITLSNIGYVGDLQYIDGKVQDAINKAFNSKQEAEAQAIVNAKNEAQAQSELVQAQKKAQAMSTLQAMKELEIKEILAKGLADGNIKLPNNLVVGADGNMLFNLPLK